LSVEINIGFLLLLLAVWVIEKGFSMAAMRKMQRQVCDLYNWHDKEDEDGVKVWYVRRSLEEAIKQLADNIAAQTDLLDAYHNEIILQRKMFEAEKRK